MGHYASEMISDEEWERERKIKEERHNRIAERIKVDLSERGLEHVLAQIIENPSYYKY
jgi:hypothetical protein